MKKAMLFLFACVMSYGVLAQKTTKTYDLPSFQAISTSNFCDVVVKQGSSQEVKFVGPQSLVDKLEVEVENRSLRIRTKKGQRNFSIRGNATFYITVPELKAVTTTGSGDFAIEGDFEADEFAITTSGSGDVKASGNLTARKMAVVTTGSGDISLNGSADKIAITNSGSGDIHAGNLKSKDGAIVNSGSGDLTVYVTGSVAVTNTGSGDIGLKGSPEKKTIVNTGSGDIDYQK